MSKIISWYYSRSGFWFRIFGGFPPPSYVKVSEKINNPFMIKGFHFDIRDIKLIKHTI